jgi:hypothetical protein
MTWFSFIVSAMMSRTGRTAGHRFFIRLRLRFFRFGQQPQGQGLQAFFTGDGGARPALGSVRQVKVFETSQRGSVFQIPLELGCQQFPFNQGFEDGLSPLVQPLQLFQPVTDPRDGHFVEAAGGFLAVTADERNGSPVVQQFGDGGSLARGNIQFRGNEGQVIAGHGSSPVCRVKREDFQKKDDARSGEGWQVRPSFRPPFLALPAHRSGGLAAARGS